MGRGAKAVGRSGNLNPGLLHGFDAWDHSRETRELAGAVGEGATPCTDGRPSEITPAWIASHQSSLPNAAKGYPPREPREPERIIPLDKRGKGSWAGDSTCARGMGKRKWADPGIEPGTSSTQTRNHPLRPIGQTTTRIRTSSATRLYILTYVHCPRSSHAMGACTSCRATADESVIMDPAAQVVQQAAEEGLALIPSLSDRLAVPECGKV